MSRMLSTAKLILFAAIFGAMIFVGCNNSSSDDEPNGGGSTTVPDDPGTGGGTTDPDDTGGVGTKFFSDLGVIVTGPIVDKNYGDNVGADKTGIPTPITKVCTHTESDGLVTFTPADGGEVRAMYTFDKGVSMKDYATLEFTSKSYAGNICLYLADSGDVAWDSAEFIKGLTGAFYKIGNGENKKDLVKDTVWNSAFDNSKYLVGAQIYNSDELIIGGLTVEKGSDDAISVTAMEIKIAENGTAGYTWTQYGEPHEVTGIAYTIEMDEGCTIEDGKLKIPAEKSASIDFGEDIDISKFTKISFTYSCTVSNSYKASVLLFKADGNGVGEKYGIGAWSDDKENPPADGSGDIAGKYDDKGNLTEKATALKTIKFNAPEDFDWTINSVKFE